MGENKFQYVVSIYATGSYYICIIKLDYGHAYQFI